MEREIIRADRRLRILIVWIAAVLLVGGLVGLTALHRHFDRLQGLSEADYEVALRQVQRLTTVFCWVVGASFAGIGLWFGRLAWKVLRTDRYPPPGWKVVKDTPVRTGRDARRMAYLLLGGGILVAGLGVACAWYLHRLALAALGA